MTKKTFKKDILITDWVKISDKFCAEILWKGTEEETCVLMEELEHKGQTIYCPLYISGFEHATKYSNNWGEVVIEYNDICGLDSGVKSEAKKFEKNIQTINSINVSEKFSATIFDKGTDEEICVLEKIEKYGENKIRQNLFSTGFEKVIFLDINYDSKRLIVEYAEIKKNNEQ